jgi:ABC-2 type transport system permease protein
MVNTFRFGILGVTDIDVSVALMIIFGFILLLTAYSLRLLSRGVGIRD